MDRCDVVIYMRDIKLDVVIPEKHAWNFMKEFGKAFAIKNDCEGYMVDKPVDAYYTYPASFHIQVSVWENDEERFYDFLRAFCSARNLSFRDPKMQPAV